MPDSDSPFSPDALEKQLPSWVVPLGVFVVAFAVRLFHLDYNGFWTDEWTSLNTSRLPWSGILMERASRGHLPLFFWFLKGWREVVGEGEYRLRLLPTFFSAMSVVAIYLFGRRAMTNRVALFAAILFCFHQRCLWSAHDLRMYSMVLCLGIFSFCLVWKILAGNRSFFPVLLLFLCHVAGLLTHPTYLGIIGAQGLYLLAYWRRYFPFSQRVLCIVLVSSLLAASPFYRIMLISQQQDFYGESKIVNLGGVFGGLTQSFFGEHEYLWGSGFKYLAWPILFVILGSAITGLRRTDSGTERRSLVLLLIWWASPFLLAALVSLTMGAIPGGTRYFIVAAPAACLIASRVLMGTRCPRRRLVYASGFFLLVATIGGAYLFSRGEGLRQGVEFVLGNRKAGEPLLVCKSDLADIYMPFYGADAPPLYLVPQRYAYDEASRRAQLLDTVGDSRRVWLLLYKPRERDLEKLLSETMAGWETQKLFRIDVTEVWLLERTPPQGKK